MSPGTAKCPKNSKFSPRVKVTGVNIDFRGTQHKRTCLAFYVSIKPVSQVQSDTGGVTNMTKKKCVGMYWCIRACCCLSPNLINESDGFIYFEFAFVLTQSIKKALWKDLEFQTSNSYMPNRLVQYIKQSGSLRT